jgi:uracil-DNA glycosylase family 4
MTASPADIESVLGYTGHPQGPHRVRDNRYASAESVFEKLSETGSAPSPSPSDLDPIIANARNGRGPCEGCVAHTSGNSRLVNPGLSNYSGELMFVTEEPKHSVNWDDEEGWAEWNERFMRGFDNASGGEYIKTLLQPLDISMNEVWIADSLKCPTEAHDELGTVDIDTATAYEHCQQYLERELREVDPTLIVTLGNKASERVLGIFGEHVSIHTKKSDYGRVFDTQPPVVVSPHWSAYNWMTTEGTEHREETVQAALEDTYHETEPTS